MDIVTQTFWMWTDEAIIVMAALLGVALFYFLPKLLAAPADVILAIILGLSAIVVTMVFRMNHHLFGIAFGTRTGWFIALYLWCVLGMLFFAGPTTSRVKLGLGMAGQAGILYALFVLL